MKNKNFTTSVVAFLSRGSSLLVAILFLVFQQNVFAQTADCPLSANDLVQVVLGDDCQAIVTPNMVIEGENEAASCDYEIFTIVDEAGNQVGKPDSVFVGGVLEPTGNWILEGDKDYYYNTLMASVRFRGGGNNFTMGGIVLADKIKPTLRCLDTVSVSCSEVLSGYLTTNTDAYYEYNGEEEITNDAGTLTSTSLPVIIPAGEVFNIPILVDNQAMQSEIIDYVVPVIVPQLGLSVSLKSPTDLAFTTNLESNSSNYFNGQQASNQFVNGVWVLKVHNSSASSITLNSAKLFAKSKKFTSSIGGVNAVAYDNCHNDDLTIKILTDVIEDNDVDCGEWFKERKIRYQAIDWEDNKSDVCEHVIRWEKKGLEDLEWPNNYDGLDESPLSCDGFLTERLPSGDLSVTTQKWDDNGDGYPQPEEIDVPKIDGFPIFPDNHFCMVNVTYTDEVTEECPGTYKILRKWVAYDMCAPGGDDCCDGDANPRTHYQIIKVININKPVFSSDMVKVVHFSTSTFKCESDCDFLPAPLIHSYEGCGGDLTYDLLYCPEEEGVYQYIGRDIPVNSKRQVCNLPIGETCITYVVKDECGNEARGNLTVVVEDDVPPIPVCDEHTVATVTTDCTARVKANTFDDGSIDNCDDDLSFLVKKMGQNDGYYDEFVEYGSADVGETRVVILKVIDDAGNWNTCMVEVYIDDKIYPTIDCPDDIEIGCGEDPYDVEKTGGEPEIWDNCTPTLKDPVHSGTLSQCNVGTITRTWTVTDGAKTATCSQRINVVNFKPFAMYADNWPDDVLDLVGCKGADTDPSKTGEPDIDGDDFCSMVAVTYTDRVFDVVQGACYKILRDWTVIDWCQYEENNPDSEGIWTHTQVIMVNDTDDPVFTAGCDDREIPAYNSDCTGDVDIFAEADDCTPDNELVWSYKVYNDDNTLYRSGNTNRFVQSHMATGSYRIHWVVEDKCGNFSECDMSFTVKDAKNPTPLCYSEITTVVMPSTTPKMVTVNARDFDRGSDDNCDKGATCGDCDTDLRFSFSGTNPNERTRTFTDADVGVQHLEMWVWDRAGNKDFCNVTLHVQDNPDTPQGIVQLGGTIRTEGGDAVSEASVTVENMDLNETAGGANSNANGYYQLGLPDNSNYEITVEKEGDYLNGLTTLDIVLIQKHILGIKSITSPYKLLAADVNMDGKLTGGDILEIRKLILGKTNKFKSGRSWSFVSEGFEFNDPEHPWVDSENGLYNIVVNDIRENTMSNDFIGLKLGDINNTVDLNGTSQFIQTRGVKSLTVDNVMFETGEYISVPVYASDFENINGLQMNIEVNDEMMEFVSVEAGNMTISKGNYSIKDNQLSISWDSQQTLTYSEDEVLFTLKLKAKKDGQLINQLQMGNRISSEVYDSHLDIYSMELNFRNEYNKEGQFVLYQNTPNPFSSETEISFEIPNRGIVAISIYDITGKEVVNISREFERGYNSVVVSKDDLKNTTGVLYYRVKNNGNTIVKKMIVINK